MHIESRRWFQWLVGLSGCAIAVALALPLFLALPAQGATRALVVFLAAGAVVGFERLLALVLPVVLLKVWPSLEKKAL